MAIDVSVVIPAFNAEATLAATLRSVIAQTAEPAEIIVVDDGSSDGTAYVAERFGARVQVLRQANAGPGGARNAGIRLAHSTWIGLLDADDLWLPTKLERQLQLDDDEHIGILACLSDRPGHVCPDYVNFDALWERNVLVNSTVLLRRAAWEQTGGFNEARALISVEDYNLWLRVAANGWRVRTRQEVLAHYTRGVGISSNRRRLLAASLFNLESLRQSLDLPASRVRRRRAAELGEFARAALYDRDLMLARELTRQLARTNPNPANAAWLAVAYLPAPLLETRRALRSVAFGRDAKQPGLFGEAVIPAYLKLDQPLLLVIIDTEEEFDWSTVPSAATGVGAMRHQEAAQRIFERFGCRPTYVVDYAVAANRDGYAPLREFLASGACFVGAQLHPWVNPPLEEVPSQSNTFPGNLERHLEAAKLRVLTETISTNLGVQPTVYRAGRYGLGRNTPELLAMLGYRVDCSVRPYFDIRDKGGPDYRTACTRPFWLDPNHTLLELPVTVGLTGLLAGCSGLLTAASHPRKQRLRLAGILARSRLLDRIQLTPEGTRLSEARRLTRAMLADGHRVFVVSYHSPSLQPGNTPYVRTAADLQRFLAWLEQYFEFFLGEVGGRIDTVDAVYAAARRHAPVGEGADQLGGI